jgi:cell division septation protein DedD
MADQNFHEIQLSGKQLIFLFMCAVVLTVVVFLFGVSVGRQVPAVAGMETEAATAAAPAAADAVPAAAPAPAPPAANEVSYADALAAADDPTKAAPPPVSDEPTTEVQTAQAPPPAAPKSAPQKPDAPAAKAAAKAAPAPSGANAWFVQVGAFNADDVAGREVTKLKGRGYPASVLTEPPTVPGPRFKVRVGPYDRTEADRVRVQLSKEGYPSFLRR